MPVYPAHSTDDYWAQVVKLFTGYPIPDRANLFDSLVGGDEKIPLMEVEISDMDSAPEDDLYTIVDNLYWRVENSGTSIETKNIVIPFYAPKSGSQDRHPGPGTELKLRQASIRLLGSNATSSPPTGGVVTGTAFGSYSDLALSQYSYGSGRALEALIWGHTTAGFEWSGLHVPMEHAVDYNSFDRAADAFTRAAIFFDNQNKVLQRWQERLGGEHSEWRGQAAGVFADLVHKINKLYQEYSEDMPRIGTAGSLHAERLRAARETFVNELNNLQQRWAYWELWQGNPLRWLHDILLKVTKHIWDHNITATGFGSRVDTSYNYNNGVKYEDYIEVDRGDFDAGYGDYGHLESMATWKKIGEEAIGAWQESVTEKLGNPSRESLMRIKKAFDISLDPVSARGGPSLSEELQKDKAEKEKGDLEKKQKEQEEENKRREKKEDEYREEQERKQEERERKQEEKEKELDRKQEEREREQERKQAEQERKQEERQQELDRKQEEREREQEAKQEAKEREQQQAQAIALAQARADREKEKEEQRRRQAELDAKQEEREQEQEAKQAEQERKQEERQRELDARQEAKEKEQQAKQAEQERKQEQLRIKTETEYKEQQAEQEAKQEERQEEQERKQEQVQREQDQRQRELQAQQEQRQQEQDRRQQELVAQQDQRQQEQEAKQEQRQQEQVRRQRELQAQQDQRQQELQKQQEQRQREQEQRQQHLQEQQDQRQQQLQHDQDQRQQQLQQDQAQRQRELQERFDQLQRETPSLPDFHDSRTILNPDGSVTQHFSDGGFTTVDPGEHTGVTVLPDGSVDFESLSPGESVHNPDGSWTTLNPDGTVTTDFPDGRSTVIDPDRHQATTTYPDGRTETTPLSPGSALPGPQSVGSDYDYRSSYPGYEEELYDNRPYDPTELLSAYGSGRGQAGDGGAPSYPMMPPGMTMGGQVSAGSASSAERVRTVIDGRPQLLARRGDRRGTGGYEEVGAAQRVGTSSGTPFMPPMGGMGGGNQAQTESNDRERSSWLAEDEDVWGTDEGGAPAVIGR
ncbi:AAWKG family protein [Streptomyces sp.]|uniref:AAWKG family protein n=1 Tax=Streptomyces sp. TaxID=1931 RepID=UPI002F404549